MLQGLLAPACVVPFPLKTEQVADGGRVLMVRSANPPFGLTRAIRNTQAFVYSLEIESDSDTLAGRLYLQVNESCCDLVIESPSVTRFVRDAAEIAGGPTGTGLRTLTFGTVVPCDGFTTSGALAYLVPVVTTGRFLENPGTSPDADGIVDKNHYWSVRCP